MFLNQHAIFVLICARKLNVITTLPVWSLHTGKHFEGFNFKHPSSVQCVKISSTAVYSSCNRGLVKVWDMETASLLRVRLSALHTVQTLI